MKTHTITAEQQKAIGEICRALTRKLDQGGKPGFFLIELTRTFPFPSPIQKRILRQTRQALEGAMRVENSRPIYDKMVEVLCGWGDTLDEQDVLSRLTAIAEFGSFNRKVDGKDWEK